LNVAHSSCISIGFATVLLPAQFLKNQNVFNQQQKSFGVVEDYIYIPFCASAAALRIALRQIRLSHSLRAFSWLIVARNAFRNICFFRLLGRVCLPFSVVCIKRAFVPVRVRAGFVQVGLGFLSVDCIGMF
jgi:hypothetical protein